MRANPLLVETWRGIAGRREALDGWLPYLLLQGLVLLLWWPWGTVERYLDDDGQPLALVAVVIALGVTLALHAVRAGAEERLLPGQRPLPEWVADTALPLAVIVRGYLAAHLLHAGWLLLLSAPLLAAAFAVADADAAALAWCVAVVAATSLLFRLAGAVFYVRFGVHGTATWVGIRVMLAAWYVVTAILLPAVNPVLLAQGLLLGGAPDPRPGVAVPLLLAVPCTLLLLQLLSRYPRGPAGPAANTRPRLARGGRR